MPKRLTVVASLAAFALVACEGAQMSPAAPTGQPTRAPSLTATPAPTQIDYDALLYGYQYQPTSGVPGGKVVISGWAPATQLNPWYAGAFSNFEVLATTMRTLLRVTSDGHWQPDLAADPITYGGSVTTDSAGSGFTVRLTLRPNLKWSDGVPMTLNDFKYTWTWVNDPAQVGITPQGMEKIDRIEVDASGLTADVHFKEAFAGWLGTVGGTYIMPEHYMKTIPVKDAAAKSYPVSSAIANGPSIGPFKYVTATADTIELTRDPGWAGPAEACRGRACLDDLTFKFFPEKDGEMAAFLAGEVDVATGLIQTDYDSIKGVDPAIGRAVLEPGWQYEHLDMNEAGLGTGKGHPALKDVVVRTAIEQAIDKQALYRTVFPGAPLPTTDACTNATPTNYWQLPNAKCPAFDVAAANAALDAAGYARAGDGIRIDPKSGTPLVFENCASTAAFRVLAADFITKSLRAIGMELHNDFVDTTGVLFASWADAAADTKCNLAHGNYDLTEFAYVLSFDLFGDYYYSYHSEQIPTEVNKGDGYNYLRLNDPDMDDAIDVLTNAISPADQVQAAYRIQDLYDRLVPEVALYYRNEARGVSVRLQNFLTNPSTGTDMWNVEDWWLQP
jgi:peptide/nickel transport system substrate-binding protein